MNNWNIPGTSLGSLAGTRGLYRDWGLGTGDWGHTTHAVITPSNRFGIKLSAVSVNCPSRNDDEFHGNIKEMSSSCWSMRCDADGITLVSFN